MRRGAYFYVIDAFIASILIIGTLIIIFSQYSAQPIATQAFYTAEDLLSTMESTSVRGYDNPTVRNWLSNGTIADGQRTLIEQLVLFNVTGNAQNNTGKLATIVGGTTPSHISIEILLNNQQFYVRETVPKNSASTVLSAKRIVLLRQGSTQLYSPVIVEVRTWQ